MTETDKTEYKIKPEKGTPTIDTSTWPLLLKVRPLVHLL